VRDLQAYAMHKPQETLSTIKNCLRVAEQTKDAAGETMALLHAQGDQILRTHETVVKVDQHLTVVILRHTFATFVSLEFVVFSDQMGFRFSATLQFASD
jgi:hypothetical protein